MDEVTRVVFRVFKDGRQEVIAVFPDLWLGQHVKFAISRTRPAKPEEYAALKKELESAPYHYSLRVVKRA